ncbi:hypothetical protein Tco_0001326 [Tanacetum coccineum]
MLVQSIQGFLGRIATLVVPSIQTEQAELGIDTMYVGEYVVPTGRAIATDSVIVATSGYVVPAAYDISPGLKDLSRAETYKWYQSLERVSVEE